MLHPLSLSGICSSHFAPRIATFVVALSIGGALAPSAAHAEAPRARAAAPRRDPSEQLFDEARAHYQRGEYRRAIAKLEAALVLDPQGSELVYNLALIHEKLGEIDAAERYYRGYLRMEDDPKQRARVEAILQRLEGAKQDVAPQASREAVATRAPETTTPPSRPLRPWALAAAGSAAGALVVGTAFGVSALSSKPGRDATTSRDLSYAALRDDASSAHRHAIVADISFALAAVAGAAAVYLFVRSEDPVKATAFTFSGSSGALEVQF